MEGLHINKEVINNMQEKPIYVLDTNIIIDYPNIIPNGEIFVPNHPTIDLSRAHIVIPTAVIRELSNFKTETTTDRGRIAREVLKKLRNLFEGHEISPEESYQCAKPIESHSNSEQVFSILPVSEEFIAQSSFRPTSDDMDGQIILATMALKKYQSDIQITLLTNDNGLAIRATALGIKTNRYGYTPPRPYTGRRDVTVPSELFETFWNCSEIPLEDWKQAMPDEPELIANEFIIMDTDFYPQDYELNALNHISNVGRYDAERQTIVNLKYAYNFPVKAKSPGQAIFAEALMDPKIPVVICTGPAGTGKTFLSAIWALDAVRKGQYLDISVVPCGRDKDNLGALPGEIEDKLDPYVQPIKNAIRNYLLTADKTIRKDFANIKKFGYNDDEAKNNKKNGQDEPQTKKTLAQKLEDRVNLDYGNWFNTVPIDFARGRDFSQEIAIYDEFQDQNFRQADTLIKRLGENGKIIITGDIEQIHSAYLDRENNGIVYASNILQDSPMVARISLSEAEVVRHPLVKLVAERQKSPT